MTYDEMYEIEKRQWEKKHPGRDYDEFINGEIDRIREYEIDAKYEMI